jgi:hypothetical protein
MESYMQLAQCLKELDEQKITFDAATNNYGMGNESINLKSFVAHLTALTQKSRNVINMLLDTDDHSEGSSTVSATIASQYRLSDEAAKVNWIVMGEKIGFKAVGQSTFTSALLDLMSANMDEVESCRVAIVNTNRELGNFILDPELINRFSPDRSMRIESAKKFTKDFSAMWKGVAGIDRDAMSSIYRSYRQFEACSEMLNVLTVKFDKSSVASIHGDMKVLDDTLDRLLAKLADGDECNTSSARKLGDLIYNLAEWVSISALFITKMVAINKAHLDNVGRINDIATGKE